jgi:hypothetical protein
MGGVPLSENRVQLRQTTKQVLLYHCGLTSERKNDPFFFTSAMKISHPLVLLSLSLSLSLLWVYYEVQNP